MNIIEAQFKPFVMMSRDYIPDGEGGFMPTSVWRDGTEFQAATRIDSSMVAKIAQSQGVTSVITIYTKKSVTLKFNDVVKDVKSGVVYKITSDAKGTPDTSTLNLNVVSAERWSLPND